MTHIISSFLPQWARCRLDMRSLPKPKTISRLTWPPSTLLASHDHHAPLISCTCHFFRSSSPWCCSFLFPALSLSLPCFPCRRCSLPSLFPALALLCLFFPPFLFLHFLFLPFTSKDQKATSLCQLSPDSPPMSTSANPDFFLPLIPACL